MSLSRFSHPCLQHICRKVCILVYINYQTCRILDVSVYFPEHFLTFFSQEFWQLNRKTQKKQQQQTWQTEQTCISALPWDISSCWISSRTASSSYSFMTLNICLEEQKVDLHLVTQVKWFELAQRLGWLITPRDRPLPCHQGLTARAASGPLTARPSTPPPSPPGQLWRPRSRCAADSLPSADIFPAASTGCFWVCPHSAAKDAKKQRSATCLQQATILL